MRKYPSNQRTVFVRLIGIQLISVSISLLIIGLLFGYLVEKYYYGLREWELIEVGERLTQSLLHPVVLGNVNGIREELANVADTDVEYWVMDNTGQILVGSRMASMRSELTIDANEVDHVLNGNNMIKKIRGPDHQHLLVVLPISNQEQLVSGALAMRAPLSEARVTINNVMRLVLIAGSVAGLVVLLVSFFMAKGFAKPLESLQEATLAIAKGDFPRLDLPPHSKEVDHVIAAFNYASQQIEKTNHEQQCLNLNRTEFLSSISHELRHPLTSLKGFLELMEQPLSEVELESFRQIMFADTLYLERLLDDVLDLTKMELGQLKLDKEKVDLRQLVRRVVDSKGPEIEKAGLTINWETALDLPRIMADPRRMQQVVLNIFTNALYHSHPNGEIRLALYQYQQVLVFEITDFGVGISEEDLPYIWERFYKLDKARTRSEQGSGLGLAIVKQLIQAHGGHVSVESKAGRGSTFRVALPLEK